MLECLQRARERSQVPVVFMTCINPLLRMGLDQFATAAQEAGADGVLVTDLPPSESDEWVAVARGHDLDTVFLVAPSSTEERVRAAVELTTGFVYCVSRPGVTGVREQLPADLAALVERIRTQTSKPVAVGFGISRPEHVRRVCELADGAVVGSAVVRVIAEAGDARAPERACPELCRRAAEFVRDLAAGTHREK